MCAEYGAENIQIQLGANSLTALTINIQRGCCFVVKLKRV